MSWTTAELVGFVSEQFARLADPKKSGPMASYMKTTMPFYGIQKPERLPIYKEMKKRFKPASIDQYQEAILALWNLAHREEKYAALEFAKQHKEFMCFESYELYEQLIRDGSWWDLVDDIAVSIVSDSYLLERSKVKPIIDRWIDDPDMWIRRSAILAHNHHKSATDSSQLFAHILKQSHDQQFFIRKAIGWALREYSHVAPEKVATFVTLNKSSLSQLSFREATKALVRKGLATF